MAPFRGQFWGHFCSILSSGGYPETPLESSWAPFLHPCAPGRSKHDCFPLRDVAVDPSLTFAEHCRYMFLIVLASAASRRLGCPNPPPPQGDLGGPQGTPPPPQGPRAPSGPGGRTALRAAGVDGASRRPQSLFWFILADVLHERSEDEKC